MLVLPFEGLSYRLPCFLAFIVTGIFPPAALGFETFEHRYIGNAAYEKAITAANPTLQEDLKAMHFGECPNTSQVKGTNPVDRTSRLLCQAPLNFGDLSALAGDFVGSWNELRKLIETVQQLIATPAIIGSDKHYRIMLAVLNQWLRACRWYELTPGALCFDKLGSTEGGRMFVSSDAEQAEMEQLPDYINLAASDAIHFPRRSWKEFIVFHASSLKEAKKYALSRSTDSLKTAIFQEGWAQHFLQDSFSAGHIGSPWGECSIGIICSPPRAVLQHTHNELNEIGLEVTNGNSGQKPWVAYGDRNLFVKSAGAHRAKVVEASYWALQELIAAAQDKNQPDDIETVCRVWILRFPVPPNPDYRNGDIDPSICSKIAVDNGWPEKNAQDLGVMTGGRSVVPEVSDVNFEGWKVFGSLGRTWGELDKVASNGSVETARNSAFAGSFEMAYVRSGILNNIVNVFGWGVQIVPGSRINLYPVSVGHWWQSTNGLWWGGIRLNAGARIEQPGLQQNPGSHEAASFLTSIPMDIGLQLFPPISVYLRSELFSINFSDGAHIESPFNRQYYIGLGLAWDFGKVVRQ